MNELVSVIIPTYNRFKYLLNAIDSIKKQTYKNIEIIVVNDCSTDKRYYNYDWKSANIHIIHLKKNTREVFGFPCVGHVINIGTARMSGEYFATCDDDDCWLPKKLELQLKAMQETGCKMSTTEGLIGNGPYTLDLSYQKYNSEYYYDCLKSIYKKHNSNLLDKGFPKIWNYDFIKVHNCIIASSVIIHKDIIKKIGKQRVIKMGGCVINNKIIHIDYDYWLRALYLTNSVYINEPCVYYDNGHADGQNY